jgi:hypothetical protein
MSAVIIHINRSDLDLRLMLREIDPAAYAATLLTRIRQELPVLAPLSDAAVLSLVPALPPEVLAANLAANPAA